MSSVNYEGLCQTFGELTHWTNQSIAKGFVSGLGILEESITDFTLNEIAFRHREHVYTKKFSRKQEGCESGADWLWCIGGPGAWLSLLVQAKVVNPLTKRCHFLGYSTPRGKQCDALLKYARTNRLFPVYCIYSLIEEDTRPEAMALKSLSRLTAADWACSFVIPRYVKQLLLQNQKTQSNLLRYGIPWRYPFCEAARMTEVGLAQSVAQSFLRVRKELSEQYHNAVSANRPQNRSTALATISRHKPRMRWDDVDPTQLVTSDIPRLVIRLLRSRVRHDDAPIGAVSIVSTIPVEAMLSERGALPAPNDELPVFRGPKEREKVFWGTRW
jgi:hypothetical protein